MDTRISPVFGSRLESNPLQSKSVGTIRLPGRFKSEKKTFIIDEDVLSKHLMLIGGTGCGKSNVFYHLVSQTKSSLSSNDVMIIFDTKGAYYRLFGKPGDLVLGNSPQFKDLSVKWNFFREVLSDGWDWARINLNLNELSWALFKEIIEKSKDPFFPTAARDLFSAIVTCLLEEGFVNDQYKKEVFYNSELSRALNESTIADIIAMLQTFPGQASVLSYLGDGSSAQALGVYAEMQSVLRKVFVGVFADKGAFSIRNFVREKGGHTLFIEYDMSIGNTLAPMYSLLFDLALKEALGRSSQTGNLFLFCDEFRLLPFLQHIDDGVNFGRSLGVKVIAGLQSINQLTEQYGDARGKNILAGFSSIFAFKANDAYTRDYITNLYGKNLVAEQHKTITNTVQEERREGHVVEDWDMSSLSVGEAVIGLPFCPPFKYQFDLYKGDVL